MRRPLSEDPITRAGRQARFLALLALVVSLIAVVMVRSPRTEAGPALAVLGSGLVLALLAIVFAGFAFIRVWREGARGLGAAVAAVFLASLLLAYPAYAALRGLRLPAITDVSTDTEQPPAFSRSRAAYAARDGRLPPDPGRRRARRNARPTRRSHRSPSTSTPTRPSTSRARRR